MKRALAAIAAFVFALVGAQAQTTFPVTVSISPAGAGTLAPMPSAVCPVGTSNVGVAPGLGCVATAAPGWTFDHWSATAPVWCTGSTSTTCGTYGITSAGGTLVANFAQAQTATGGSTSSGGSTPTTATACGALAAGQTCAQAFGHACVNLSWNAAAGSTVTDPGTVTVLRSTSASGPFAPVTSGAPAGGPCLDTTVAPGQTYFYEVDATINADTGPLSSQFEIAVPALQLLTPSIAVTVSPSSTIESATVSLTVTVSGTPTPTGSIALSGAGVSGSTALVSGSATFTIAGGTLAVGTAALTATYTPDAASSTVFNPVTGSASIAVSPGAPASLGGTIAKVVGGIPFQMAINTARLFWP